MFTSTLQKIDLNITTENEKEKDKYDNMGDYFLKNILGTLKIEENGNDIE